METTTSAPTTTPLPIERIRGQFPLLKREIGDKRISYLDNAATSQKPETVIEAMDRYYRLHNANIHRGVYAIAEEATEQFEGTRLKVADWVGAGSEREIIFVRNATEAINLVAYSWGRANIGAGDLILITEMEHHSNIVPWQQLADEKSATLEYVPIDEGGQLDREALAQLLAKGPKLVAIAHISNVLGTINPVVEIVEKAHDAGSVVLVDGAQAAPQIQIDMAEIGADFYVFTGHKMYGPTGIGVLYGRRELLEEMPPFLTGGDMISSVDWHGSRWNDLPWKFEAGTSAIAEGVGLGAAVDWIREIGMEAIRSHELKLTEYALYRLAEVPGLRIFGPRSAEQRGSLISFDIEGIHPHDVAQIVDRDGVCIRAGHHCAMPLMKRLGVTATSRASFAVYNTSAEIDQLMESLGNARRIFKLDQ